MLGDGRPWHADHGFGDLCVACHAGDPAAASKEAAHAAMVSPLDDPARACAGCHADAEARALRYREAAAAKPVGSAMVASQGPAAPGPSSGGPAGAVAADGRLSADRVFGVLAAGLALLLVGCVARDRHAMARLRPMEWLRATTWSPYVAGAGLGIVVANSEALYGRPIAASGAFDKLAAYLGRALFPSSPYYAYVMHPGITWQVWLMLGVLLGSFASAKLAGVARRRWLPDRDWEERFGARRAVRLLVAFLGAMLVQIGAGIAGGCTSGLAISGGAVLAPAAFVFMAGMFAGGIPTAWAWAHFGRRRPVEKR